jgi:hypothetical protein
VLSEVIKLAKYRYYNKIISNSKNKIKTSWNIIRSVTNNTARNAIPMANVKGKSCNNVQTIANVMNNFFISLVQGNGSIANGHEAIKFLTKSFKRPFPNIKMTPVTNKEVKDIVKSLKWKSSYGYDEIPQRILKIPIIKLYKG